MVTLSNFLETNKILIAKKFQIECCVSGYHYFGSFCDGTKQSFLTACKENKPAFVIINKYTIAFKNPDGVTVTQIFVKACFSFHFAR